MLKLTSTREPVSVFWFRRDLRLHDNRGLAAALAAGLPVLPVFIFDRNVLSRLEDRDDKRVEFIQRTLHGMNMDLRRWGSGLQAEVGTPLEAWKKLVSRFPVRAVYFNHDYEPYARRRDGEVAEFLRSRGIEVKSCKDQVIFEKLEVEKETGGAYTVFTPFSRKWRERLKPADLKACSIKSSGWAQVTDRSEVPALQALGFRASPNWTFPQARVANDLLKSYGRLRDFPAAQATSRLGLHLRFGTVSVREIVRQARERSPEFLNELIWREFFMQILWNFPHVVERAFRPEYEKVKFRKDRAEFELWCEGKTGYPIVDAGMRELNATGFMHNRVRMIAASFLVKHLFIDWRWGEAYFARKLLDFDLASNNGNWQWVAGTGCDAAPYFRVFNPELQAKKFDPKSEYIKRWVPEFGSSLQLEPMISHVQARLRALRGYGEGLGKKVPAR